MRISDYQNVHGVKEVSRWTNKTSRVKKAHEDEFEKELADCLNKRKSQAKPKRKKDTKNEDQTLFDESQGRDKMLVETDHLFTELETDIDLDEEKPNKSDRFSGWV